MEHEQVEHEVGVCATPIYAPEWMRFLTEIVATVIRLIQLSWIASNERWQYIEWLLMKGMDLLNACRTKERVRGKTLTHTSRDTLTKSWNQIQRAIKNIVCISSDNSFRMFPFLVFI